MSWNFFLRQVGNERSYSSRDLFLTRTVSSSVYFFSVVVRMVVVATHLAQGNFVDRIGRRF